MGRFHHFPCGGSDNHRDEFHKRRSDKGMVGHSGVRAPNCNHDHSDLHFLSNSEENKGWTESGISLLQSERINVYLRLKDDSCLVKTYGRLIFRFNFIEVYEFANY